jgi:hypothetical protein
LSEVTSTTAYASAVRGISHTPNGRAIFGLQTAVGGIALQGYSSATTGSGVGIRGQADGDHATALSGWATSSTGPTVGLYGDVASSSGTGLVGRAYAGSGVTTGILASVYSPTGTGLVINNISGGKLFSGQNNGSEMISMNATTGSATFTGGVQAASFAGNGSALTSLTGANVTGTVPSATSAATATTAGSLSCASCVVDTQSGMNVVASASGATAVSVQATELTASNTAISGIADGADGTGIVGQAMNGDNAAGVWGISSSGDAGLFQGNVSVTGTLSASSKSFRIDDPLDPANKFLVHASVESAELKTIYDGTVTLDADGAAVVRLPDWFEALNGDFRYQLTCVGGYAPVYIAQRIRNNAFEISGGTPGLEVDWQVTGVRRDPYAEAHPLRVEMDKTEKERGYYLHPELYGQSAQKGIEWADHPGVMARLSKSRGNH